MPSMTLSDPGKTVKVDSDQPMTSEWAGDALLEALAILNAAVPIAVLLWERTAPGVYDYKLTLKDGRLWKQTVAFQQSGEPLQTFAVTDGWRNSEFSLSRSVRDALILHSLGFGISKFRVTYP